MSLRFFTGGYTAKERGIAYYEWDSEQGVRVKKVFFGIQNPSWLLLHPNRKVLYSVCETERGLVRQYEIASDGGLTFLSEVSSFGDAPCHLAISPEADILAVSNYMSGSIVFYALDETGRLGRLLYHHTFNGRGNHLCRQESAHTHTAAFQNGFCYVCELGCDGVYRIAVDRLRSGRVTDADMEPVYDFKVGGNMTGVRMGVFTRDGRYYFAGGELDCKVHSFAAEGMRYLEAVETAAMKDENTFAHIALSADETKLYGSVRGENTIVCFDRKDGRLSNRRILDCGGIGPRYFALAEPYLLVANQRSDEIVILESVEDGYIERGRISEAEPTTVVLL